MDAEEPQFLARGRDRKEADAIFNDHTSMDHSGHPSTHHGRTRDQRTSRAAQDVNKTLVGQLGFQDRLRDGRRSQGKTQEMGRMDEAMQTRKMSKMLTVTHDSTTCRDLLQLQSPMEGDKQQRKRRQGANAAMVAGHREGQHKARKMGENKETRHR